MQTLEPTTASDIGPMPQIAALPVPRPEARQRVASWLLSTLLQARNWSRLRLLSDCVLLYLAASISLMVSPGPHGDASKLAAAAFPLLVLALIGARPGPDRALYPSTLDTIFHILGAISFAAVITVATASSVGAGHPVGETVRLWGISFVLMSGGRVVLMLLRRWARALDALAVPTLILGAGQVGEHLVKRLNGDHRYGLRPVGFLDAHPLESIADGAVRTVPVLGGPDDLAAAAVMTGARHVILAFSTEPDHLLIERVRECERLGLGVSLVPRLYESISVRATLDHVGGLPLVGLRPIDPKGWQFAIKHAIGRSIAALALLLLAPAMLIIAGVVRLTSPGPVLFRQRRVGRDGHEFDLLKFRSMRVPTPTDAMFRPAFGSAPGGVEGTDRRTWIGRLLRASSLDELPQLLNVLGGDMTIVGPRPERPEFVRQFVNEIDRYEDRHRVKSGITGWAQVNGLRGQTSIADRVEWDNYYIQNWSLRLDVKIVALTVVEVFRFRDS